MLIMKIPTAINPNPSTKIVPFEECTKQLKYYFSNIKRVKSQLRRGKVIKTPYFEFRFMAEYTITPELSIARKE